VGEPIWGRKIRSVTVIGEGEERGGSVSVRNTELGVSVPLSGLVSARGRWAPGRMVLLSVSAVLAGGVPGRTTGSHRRGPCWAGLVVAGGKGGGPPNRSESVGAASLGVGNICGATEEEKGGRGGGGKGGKGSRGGRKRGEEGGQGRGGREGGEEGKGRKKRERGGGGRRGGGRGGIEVTGAWRIRKMGFGKPSCHEEN